MNPDTADVLDSGLVYIKAYVIAIVLGTLAFFSLGSLLPLWVFFNSLQMITHTILLNTEMPGNVFYVFKDYLDLVRLHIPALSTLLYDRSYYRQSVESSHYYNVFLDSSDYVHLFAQNIPIIGLSGVILISIWLALAIKDRIRFRHRYTDTKFF